MVVPARGDIWLVNPNPTQGREQSGIRPALVVSADTFNQGPRGLVIVMPMTRTRRSYPFHIEVPPIKSGLYDTGYIMCEQIRSISVGRLVGSAPIGRVSPDVLLHVEDRLRALLSLPTTTRAP